MNARLSIAVLSMLLPAGMLYAQVTTMPIGVGLNGLSYSSTEYGFRNQMKLCMPWTQQPAGTQFDADGYPLEIAAADRCKTFVFRNSPFPTGDFVLLYEGEGQIAIGGGVSNVVQSPGRITFTSTGAGSIQPIIEESRLGNHIRNMRMYRVEDTLATHSFHSQFLEKLAPLHTLRFMDWQNTNHSPNVEWADRTPLTRYTYAGADRGIPPSLMVELCNVAMKNPWVCIPHAASDDYIRQLARLFRDELDPRLTIYLEYSNEAWNASFGQFEWINANGPAELGHDQKTAYFAKRSWDMWLEEFGSAGRSRILRVCAGQKNNPDVITRMTSYLGAGGFDAISCSGYFGLDAAEYDSLGSPLPATIRYFDDSCYYYAASLTPEQIIRWTDICAMSRWTKVRLHAERARLFDVPFICYEAGQHITLNGHQTGLNVQAFYDAQRHPAMYDLYMKHLRFYRDQGCSMWMAFVLAGDNDSPWGSWGHLDYIWETTQTAVKYKALLDMNTPVSQVSVHASVKPATRTLVQASARALYLGKAISAMNNSATCYVFSLQGRLFSQPLSPDLLYPPAAGAFIEVPAGARAR